MSRNNPASTHECGCNLARDTQTPCEAGAKLWANAKNAYNIAVRMQNWQHYYKAIMDVCGHYGISDYANADAFIINYEHTYRTLMMVSEHILVNWIRANDKNYYNHALIEYSVRHRKNYNKGDSYSAW